MIEFNHWDIYFKHFDVYYDLVKSHLFQHLIFNSFRTLRIASNVVIRVGTSGKRSLFSIIPIAFNIDFTPAGFPSTNNS